MILNVKNITNNNVKVGGLENAFYNCLLTDTENNMTRQSLTEITESDPTNFKLKISYPNLSELKRLGTNGESWFLTQGSEASILAEITNVDLNTGWITYNNLLGTINNSVGLPIEPFNPFINYKFISGNKPLFDPYPTTAGGVAFTYLQSGGIIEKTDGSYVMICPVIFGSHTSRDLYYATSNDLENWTFVDTKIIGTGDIPWAQQVGNVLSLGNPLKLNNGNFLTLLGVTLPNGNYTCAYMIIDQDLNIIQSPKQIMIENFNGIENNAFPLSIIKYDNKYRLLLHNRTNNVDLNKEVWEAVFDGTTEESLFNALDNGVIESITMIQKGTLSQERGYLYGKCDDGVYLEYNGQLYMFLSGEDRHEDFVTSNNREIGLAKLSSNGKWVFDKRSPIILNPVQLFRKYPELTYCWDHIGTYMSPIIKGNDLYMFLAMKGFDESGYYLLCGIKISLEDITQSGNSVSSSSSSYIKSIPPESFEILNVPGTPDGGFNIGGTDWTMISKGDPQLAIVEWLSGRYMLSIPYSLQKDVSKIVKYVLDIEGEGYLIQVRHYWGLPNNPSYSEETGVVGAIFNRPPSTSTNWLIVFQVKPDPSYTGDNAHAVFKGIFIEVV